MDCACGHPLLSADLFCSRCGRPVATPDRPTLAAWQRFTPRTSGPSPRWRAWVIGLAIPALAIGAATVLAGSHVGPGSPGVLAPAHAPASLALCHAPLTTLADGTVTPLTCDQALNAAAWAHYGPLAPRTLTAGRGVGLDQVRADLCADSAVAHLSLPQARQAGRLASLYYGWPFATALSQWTPAGC